jgi:hypothetical protein
MLTKDGEFTVSETGAQKYPVVCEAKNSRPEKSLKVRWFVGEGSLKFQKFW